MKKAGVWRVVVNGVDHEDNKKVLELAKKYDMFLPALGLYPTTLAKLPEKKIKEALDFIRANKNKIVAIGEVGIDHYHSQDPKDWAKQMTYFHEIVHLANEIKKPLIVHSRKAETDIWEPLKEARVPVIMHCFSGSGTAAATGIERGYYFTIPCSIIRNKNQRKVAKRVPLNRLLTETDAPYLSPTPRARNDSSNIKVAIEKVSELRGEPEGKVAKAVLANFKKLFVK